MRQIYYVPVMNTDTHQQKSSPVESGWVFFFLGGGKFKQAMNGVLIVVVVVAGGSYSMIKASYFKHLRIWKKMMIYFEQTGIYCLVSRYIYDMICSWHDNNTLYTH